MEVSGRGVGVVTSGGRPMRIPAGYRVAKVVATLVGTGGASAQVTLGVRGLAETAVQRPEHVLATFLLARPDAPRAVTPGRRSGFSAAIERVLFCELADAREVLDVSFVVTCVQAPPEPFDAKSVEVRLFSESEMPWADLAFATVRNTLTHYWADRRSGGFQLHVGTIEPPPPRT